MKASVLVRYNRIDLSRISILKSISYHFYVMLSTALALKYRNIERQVRSSLLSHYSSAAAPSSVPTLFCYWYLNPAKVLY